MLIITRRSALPLEEQTPVDAEMLCIQTSPACFDDVRSERETESFPSSDSLENHLLGLRLHFWPNMFLFCFLCFFSK